MNRRTTSLKKPIALLVSGFVLCLSPLYGVFGAVLGMIKAFNSIADGGKQNPEALASAIAASLSTTAIGLLITPVGIVVVVIAIIWIGKINNKSNMASVGETEQQGGGLHGKSS